MSELETSINGESPVALEININHRYQAGEMGVIEFRIKNQGRHLIKSLDLDVNCPYEKSKTKSLKKLDPSVEKRSSFQFEPERGGEALLEVAIRCDDASGEPLVFRGETSVSISSKNEGSTSHTSFTLDIHDIEKFMGNDLSELIGGAGKDRELDAGRLNERMERKDPFWMRVDLDLDETETMRVRAASRKIILPPGDQMPAKAERALLESLDPAIPRRIFIFSMPEVVFGREPLRSHAVLRFLPDYDKDPRSATISAEQFVARYRNGNCVLSMAPRGHALMSVSRQLVGPDDEVAIAAGTDVKIGSCEFTLRITGVPRSDDARWKPSRGEIFRCDPAVDPFEQSPWDLVSFTRPANGQEEEYLWLQSKMEIGWEPSGPLGLQLGRPHVPRARLAFWNGRYYLEALGAEAVIKAGGVEILPGKILCLNAETEISFGPHRYLWRLRAASVTV
jgi:hypothetical protein